MYPRDELFEVEIDELYQTALDTYIPTPADPPVHARGRLWSVRDLPGVLWGYLQRELRLKVERVLQRRLDAET